MLITRECDYAVRIVRALADGTRLCVNDICPQEDLTPAFVYKILKKLEKAEIVQSFRGSNGGYALKKGLHEITLYELYHAVDESFYIIECLDDKKPCSRNPEYASCKVHQELERIQNVLVEELQAKTLAEILKA